MTMARVLVVDDDPGLRSFLVDLLESDGYTVASAEDGEEALRLAESFRPNLALLDGGLPGIDGRTVAMRLRRTGDLGIIFVTGADSPAEMRAGFDAGGDDYVVKPFDGSLLLRRVRAVLRRLGPAPQISEVGDLMIDEGAHRVTRNGVDLSITGVEFELLRTLVRHRGLVVTTTQLLDEVWHYRYDAHVVEASISRLRAKLEANGGSRLIQTVRGKGYTLRP